MTKRRRMQWVVFAAAVIIVSLLLGAVIFSHRRATVGVVGGRLRPCPESPNCVCSFDDDPTHSIAPLDAGDDPRKTMDHLRSVLTSLSGAEVVTDEGAYLHAEFATPVLRFVDDVEFLLDESEGVIHVRSASRFGYSDFGVNGRRVEMIRRRLGKASR